MIKELFDWVLEKLGYINTKEAVLRALPKDKQRRARSFK